MTPSEPQIDAISALCEEKASFHIDGWRHLILMPGLRILVDGAERRVDAVLCLNHDNPTYPTKLYLAEQVGTGLNYHETAFLLGRSWQTFSWRDVPANLPPIEVLAAHLAPLNKKSAA